jgi:hypothetical protein
MGAPVVCGPRSARCSERMLSEALNTEQVTAPFVNKVQAVPSRAVCSQPRQIVWKGGDPWWVLADVCAIAEIENPRNVTARLDDDEKGVRYYGHPRWATGNDHYFGS